MTAILRAAGRAFILPSKTSLPVRYWRWQWFALAFRLLAGLPFFAVLCIPYFLACGFVRSSDWLAGRFARVYRECLHRDIRHSGWKPAKRLASAPVVSRERSASARRG